MAIYRGGERLIKEASAREADINVSGTLSLTNQRLIFERVEGLFSKKRSTHFDIALDYIRGVATEGFFSKSLTVEISDGGEFVQYKFSIPGAEEWEAEIRTAVQQYDD